MDNERLLEIANVLAASGATREQIIEAVKEAKGPQPQRELTKDERDTFSGAIARAVDMMPSFRDAIGLIRPFRDHATSTLYTDRHSRVGIGALFFLPSVSSHRRATLLLHEAMHILNNHFTRHVDFYIDPSSDNSAKDLEINSLLQRHPKADLSMLLLPAQDPYKFPEIKSYEQYANLMKSKGLIPQEPGTGSSMDEKPQSIGSESEPPEDGLPSDASAEGDGSESDESGEGDGAEKDGQGESDSDSGEAGEGDSDSEGGESDSDSESGDSGSGGSGDGTPEDPDDIADSALEGSEGGSGSSQPSGTSCDHSTSEREKIADDLNIEKASSTEQAVARNNTMARVREEAAKSKERGDRAALLMLQKMELAMEPSKVNWRVIFRNIISNCRDSISMGRTEHTYRRVNRRMSSGDFIFPGMIRYEPTTIMGIDTSGSMSKKDFAYLLSELEMIVKTTIRSKDKFKAFCVDAAATEPKVVRSIRDLDLQGGGGTRMEVAVKSIELLPRKEIPDIFILATDGGTSWPAFKAELLKSKHNYKTVILITQEGSYDVAKQQLRGLADVIDISDKGDGTISY